MTTLVLTRTSLGLGTLSLPSSSFGFGHVTFGGRQWDRQFAQSPYVHGRQLTSARLQPTTIDVDLIAVTALTNPPTTLDGLVATLAGALTQFAYTVTLGADDGAGGVVTHSYAAEPADWDQGDVSFDQGMANRIYVVKATIPVHPVPTAGSTW